LCWEGFETVDTWNGERSDFFALNFWVLQV
jgi:hypothetical protein